MDKTDIEVEAWRLVCNYAESGVEDDIDESDDYTEDDHDAIVERAMDIIRDLREQHTAGRR